MSPFPDFSARSAAPMVHTQFIERWSPRAFKPQAIPAELVTAMVEAARWAPSCFNDQPWRIYTSNDHTFADYLGLLTDGNQGWAKSAGLLGFMVSQQHFRHNGKANAHADFDCGAAWMALSLQARHLGYYTHGMAGVHFDKAYEYLRLDPQSHRVVMAFAVGTLADPGSLNPEQLAKEKPNGRLSLDEVWPGR